MSCLRMNCRRMPFAGRRHMGRRHCICEVSDATMSYAVESVNWGDIVAMIRRIPVFQQGAVCLTKFGPELGETAKEIIARKDLERRSGIRAHKNEFWWGIGEKGTAQSANNLISQYNATSVLFSAIKNEEPPKNSSSSDAFVWRKYRMLGALHGYPPYMKVQVRGDIPVIAKTVADLCSLSTWPPGLILNFPQPATVIPRAS